MPATDLADTHDSRADLIAIVMRAAGISNKDNPA